MVEIETDEVMAEVGVLKAERKTVNVTVVTEVVVGEMEVIAGKSSI